MRDGREGFPFSSMFLKLQGNKSTLAVHGRLSSTISGQWNFCVTQTGADFTWVQWYICSCKIFIWCKICKCNESDGSAFSSVVTTERQISGSRRKIGNKTRNITLLLYRFHGVSPICVWYTGLILTAPKRGSITGGGLGRSAGTVRVQNWAPQPAGEVMGWKGRIIRSIWSWTAWQRWR